MRTLTLLFALLCIPLMAQVSPVAFSESRDAVSAFGPSGAITLPAAHLKVDVTYTRGKKEQRCELTVVYDPHAGYYLWHVGEPNPNMQDVTGFRLNLLKTHRAVLFADTTGIVEFSATGPFVKAWRQRTNSLDAAVSEATNKIHQRTATFERVGYGRDYKYIPVFGTLIGFDAKLPPGFKPISSGFSCEPYNAFCPSDNNTISSVTRQGSNWRLVLRNRFDVEVILDQNFDLVSAQQLTQPKK